MANNTKYDTLGQMAQKGDYAALLDKLTQYSNNKETGDMTILAEKSPGQPFTELDQLFYNIMRFAIVKKVKPKTEKTPESAMLDMLNSLGLNIDEEKNEINKEEENEKYIAEKEIDELQPHLLEVIDLMLQNGANPNTPIKNGITPFMLSCTINNSEVAKKLLENPNKFEDLKTGDFIYYKADVDMGDGRGNRPLYYATMTQSTEIMDLLVKDYNVNVDFQHFLSNNKTVFHQICESFNCEITVESDGFKIILNSDEDKSIAIHKLMDLNANPTIKDDYDNLPEMLVPTFNEEIHNEGEFSKEELALWDTIYEKIAIYRKEYEKTNVKKYKTNF